MEVTINTIAALAPGWLHVWFLLRIFDVTVFKEIVPPSQAKNCLCSCSFRVCHRTSQWSLLELTNIQCLCCVVFCLGSISSQDSIGNIPPSDYTPPGSVGSRSSIPRAGSDELPPPPLDSMVFQHRHSSSSFTPITPPPDLTRQAPFSTDTKGSRVMHLSSVRTIEDDDGQASGETVFQFEILFFIWWKRSVIIIINYNYLWIIVTGGVPYNKPYSAQGHFKFSCFYWLPFNAYLYLCLLFSVTSSRVSSKIQQLLNTLKVSLANCLYLKYRLKLIQVM